MNMTRFGDLLQTQAVLSALSRGGEGSNLVCLGNFAPATDLLCGLGSVHPVEGAKWLAALDREWKEALGGLWSWLEKSSSCAEGERLINLTPSLAARLLSRLLGQEGVDGFSVDGYGFGSSSTPWATFLQVSSTRRGSSPFNMVDLLWRVAGLGSEPRPYQLARPSSGVQDAARDILAAAAPPECSGFVAFQLGASSTDRCWPEEYFALLGGLVWEKFSLCPVLLGAASERGLSQGYADASRAPYVDLVGETNLVELSGVLQHMQALVSNDTGTMHLAAGLDIPVLALFLATAQPWDTGPFSAGNLCLEPDVDCHPCDFSSSCERDHRCRRAISPQTVFTCLEALLNPDGQPALDLVSARVWQTAHDHLGFHDLASLSGHETCDRTQWIRLQRVLYRDFLDRQTLDASRLPVPRLSIPAFEGIVSALDRGKQLLGLLGEQLKVLERSPLPAFKSKVLATVQQVQQLWEHSEHLGVLGLLWQQQTQQSSRDLGEFRGLVERYRELCRTALEALTMDRNRDGAARNL